MQTIFGHLSVNPSSKAIPLSTKFQFLWDVFPRLENSDIVSGDAKMGLLCLTTHGESAEIDSLTGLVDLIITLLID